MFVILQQIDQRHPHQGFPSTILFYFVGRTVDKRIEQTKELQRAGKLSIGHQGQPKTGNRTTSVQQSRAQHRHTRPLLFATRFFDACLLLGGKTANFALLFCLPNKIFFFF